MATTATAPRSDTVSDDRRGGAPRRMDPQRAGAAPWLFLAPYLVLFLTFVVAPIVYGLYISLHRYDFTLPNKPYVGLENYTDLFTPGSITFSAFWQAMRATAIFTVFSVPLLLVVPLMIALVMNKNFPGRNFLFIASAIISGTTSSRGTLKTVKIAVARIACQNAVNVIEPGVNRSM